MGPAIVTRPQLQRALARYDIRLVKAERGIEVWQTGWGQSFTLMPYNDTYDEWSIREVLRLIGSTVPVGWKER